MKSILNRILKKPGLNPYRISAVNHTLFSGSLIMLSPYSKLKTLDKNVIYKVWDSSYDTVSIRNYKTGKIIYDRAKFNFDIVLNIPVPTAYNSEFKVKEMMDTIRDWQKETIEDDPILQKQYKALTGKSIKL